ncbi:MAG: cytochrome C oxidase subunit IV family protein [Acidimicrobiales bacterium]
MSTETTHAAPADTAHEAHPNRDRTYVIVALVLAAITGLETFTYFESVVDFGRATMPLLLVCMVVKFYLIAAFFMHLRWDHPILRRVFITGILIALFVYAAVELTAFRFWEGTDVMPR